MIIKRHGLVVAGAALALVVGTAQADETKVETETEELNVQADPTVVETEGAMSAEELAEKAEAAGEEIEAGAEELAADAEAMGDEAADAAEEVAADTEEAAEDFEVDSELANMLQEKIDAHPQLGEYRLDVEATGEDSVVVTGMIDELEDYNALRELIENSEDVDPAQVTNEVIQN